MRSTTSEHSIGDSLESRFRLSSEGIAWLGAAVLLGSIGWSKSVNPLLLLANTMAVLFIVNGFLARFHARWVSVWRLPLPPIHACEEAQLQVAVHNRSRWYVTVSAVDQGVNWFLRRLSPGSEVTCMAWRSFAQRGRIRTTPRISSGFPFGFLRFEKTGKRVEDLIILPALGEIDPEGLRHWASWQTTGEGRSRRLLRRATSEQADVRGVRPYRPGDSIRAVHWRTSARRGELIVREYDAAPSPELVVVVDPYLPVEHSPADAAQLEAALSLAATLVRVWCRSFETSITLVVLGEEPFISRGPPSEVFAREVLIPLADVSGGAEFASPGPNVFGRTLGRAARIVVSSRPDSPIADTLSRSTGKPFVAIDPSSLLSWYQPPRNP